MPPAAITGEPGRQDARPAGRRRARPASRPLARARDEQPLHPAGAQSRASAAAVVPERVVQPSTATSPSRTSIATRSCSPNRAAASVRKRGGEGGRADHDAVGAGREGRRDRSSRPVAAADLKREPARRCDALDELERGRAGESPVEVDEVQPSRAFVAKPPRELDRIAALDRDRLSAALARAGRRVPRARRSPGSPRSLVLTRYHAIMLAMARHNDTAKRARGTSSAS